MSVADRNIQAEFLEWIHNIICPDQNANPSKGAYSEIFATQQAAHKFLLGLVDSVSMVTQHNLLIDRNLCAIGQTKKQFMFIDSLMND